MYSSNSKRFHLSANRLLLAFIAAFILVAFTSIANATALHDAAKAGDINKIKSLLDSGADVNEKSGYYMETPLHHAAYKGHTKTVKLLIKHGAKVNAKRKDDWTPLHKAAINGHTEIAEFLIDRGADIQAVDTEGDAPLYEAAKQGKTETVKLLIKHGSKIEIRNKNDYTALHGAAFNGHTETAKLLVERGADIRAKNKSEETVLHRAAYNGKAETVKFLIERGADIHAKDKWGDTPLFNATRKKGTETAKILVERGAKIKVRNNSQESPLFKAVGYGNVEAAKFLIDRGADFNAKNKNEETLLHRAAYKGQSKMAEFIIGRGSDIHAKDKWEDTPLHNAAYKGRTRAAMVLLKHGADIHAKNNNGDTPFIKAAFGGQTDIADFLIEHGADINTKNSKNETALHLAAYKGASGTVWFLNERGLKINAKRNDSWTPLHMAAYNGHSKTVDLLIDLGADIHIKDNADDTPLHEAARNGKAQTAKLLFERGADIYLKNKSGKTALDRALYENSKDKEDLVKGKEETSKFLQSVLNGTYKADSKNSTSPPNLTASISFWEPSGNKILDAEETGTLTVKVTNKGKGPAKNVMVTLKPNMEINSLSFPKTAWIGTVASQKTIRTKVKLTAANSIPTSKVSFNIEVIEVNGFDADPVKFAFSTKAFAPPKLVVADMAIDDQSGNSKVEPMENVEMTVRVQNIGHGEARGVNVIVKNGKNVFIGGDQKTTLNVGDLKAGEYRDVRFMFYTNKRIKNGQLIPIDLNITEERNQFNAIKTLSLAMNARQKNTKEFIVKGQDTPSGAITLATGLSGSSPSSAVDALPKHKSKKNPNAYAVVIGIEKYREQLPDAPYATRDAETVAKYLTGAMGFEKRNVKVLTNNRATKSDLEKTLGSWLRNRAKKPNSKVFIYFSGHGAPDTKTKSAYIVPFDGDPTYIADTGYSLNKLYANLAKLKSQEIVVALDSCFSGAGGRSVIAKGARPLAMEFDTPIAKSGKIIVLAASSGAQASSSYEAEGHGLFTYYMLKGLQGSADKNKSGKISVSELYNYLKPNVETIALEEYNNDQTPQLIDPAKNSGKVMLIGK